MKIIFLDVDGVLNAEDDTRFTKGKNKGQLRKRYPKILEFIGISDSKVENLAKIVSATDAKIVLVSSWKKCYCDYQEYLSQPLATRSGLTNHLKIGKYLVDKLAAQGLSIFDTTLPEEKEINERHIRPSYRTSSIRGCAIKTWLVRHQESLGITDWVILDDEMHDYDYAQLENLVLTDPALRYDPHSTDWGPCGLTDKEVNQSITILNHPCAEED